MHPIIFQIGPLTVYSYGLLLAIAVAVGTFLLQQESKKIKISSDEITDFVFWVIIFGVVGCRIFFILLNLDYYWHNPLDIVMIQKGGLAWQGGLILGMVTALVYIHRKKWPMGKVVDLCIPYVALGQAIGRLGCFFNGCCYGKAVSWGFVFPEVGHPVHPTQLYSTAGLLIIFCSLKIYQRAAPVPGKVFALYLMLSAIERLVVQFFRYDYESLFLGLGIFQWISIFILIVGVYVFIALGRYRRV